MTTTFTKTMGGPAILTALKRQLDQYGQEMKRLAERRDVPTDYRADLMRETVAEALAVRGEAERAFRDWASEQVADAQQRYRSDPVASAAEEIRRNTIELRLARTVDAAKAEDARRGPRVVSGRPQPNSSAWDLASRAEQAYLDGQYTDAQLYARASMELGGPATAQRAFAMAQDQLDQEHPTRRQALKDIEKVEQGMSIFSRDANAALSSVYQDAAVLAHAVLDTKGVQTFRTEATRMSLAAKTAEWARSMTTGAPYEHPAGSLPERPLSPPTPELAERRTGDGMGNLR